MKYGSVCSGIESASVAWHPLGWRPQFFAEIEPHPSAVLAYHYPHVPNLGDITKFRDWPDATLDVLVGGTPCQSFSIAGLRKGLVDPRGNLALTFLGIADRYRPEWLIWENVPGVLSQDQGRAFASILGGMAELGYHGAYRVLDAQYVRVDGFGRAVPQRRRRVFVVGNLRDWRRAAAVLFEPESLSWDSAPRRDARESVAPTISARPTGGGGLGTDFDLDGGQTAIPLNDLGGGASHALTARHSATGRYDPNGETWVAHTLKGGGFDASEDGTGRGTPIIPIAFDSKASGRNGFAVGEISPTLRSMSHSKSHQNAGGQVAIAIQERAICENPNAGPDGVGVRDDGAAYSLEARTVPQAVAFDMRGREGGAQLEGPHDTANLRSPSGGASRSFVAQHWAVRRLMPRECERLQGFPNDYTNIPWGKKDFSPDGLRYKELGNSMAANVMRWLGRRIEMVNSAG